VLVVILSVKRASNDAFDCEKASHILSVIKPEFAERLRYLFRAAVTSNPFEYDGSEQRETTVSYKQVLMWSRVVEESVFSLATCEKRSHDHEPCG
jgi:hypothetical protein